MIVADASIILAWAHGEHNANLCIPVLRLIARDGAVVPPIWPMEIANSLELAVLRKRISPTQRDKLLTDIRELAIHPDGTTTHIARLSISAMPALSIKVDRSLIDSIKSIAQGVKQPSVS